MQEQKSRFHSAVKGGWCMSRTFLTQPDGKLPVLIGLLCVKVVAFAELSEA